MSTFNCCRVNLRFQFALEKGPICLKYSSFRKRSTLSRKITQKLTRRVLSGLSCIKRQSVFCCLLLFFSPPLSCLFSLSRWQKTDHSSLRAETDFVVISFTLWSANAVSMTDWGYKASLRKETCVRLSVLARGRRFIGASDVIALAAPPHKRVNEQSSSERRA